MPHTNRAEKPSKSCNEDRISALPDDVLHHVLGFLPAVEAVHTCLLAHRWRYLWKSMRRLRINDMGRMGKSTGSDVFLTKFVSCLLLLRDPGSTLDEVEIAYAHRFEYDHAWISTWIRHALSCQAQVLTVKYPFQGYATRYLDGPPLVSRYLRRLEISGVRLKSNFLSFSSCSTLEDLKIEGCDLLETSSIMSQSLKHLSIKNCYFKYDGRVHISVPNLVSLQLKSFGGRNPLLESMMSLETAVVGPSNCFMDYCLEGVAEGCCGTCGDCCGNDDHNGGCVLLGGLSRAKNLELIADPIMFIFRRDLRWCPTFSRLKTLLLSEWCVQPDLHALVCMLEHSPVLENLTLQLRKGYVTRYLDGPPLVSQYLRRLEISEARLKSNSLNFSSCSTLEDLKIKDCDLDTNTILSQSVKHLSIKDCVFKDDLRISISVPNLVSLQLISCVGRTPFLESMLSLETAVVSSDIWWMDYCLEGFVAGECCGTCPYCCGSDGYKGGCVLLGGLSHAKNLELIAQPGMFIFNRDLRWCPTFSKLKTLLLNEWCVQPDLRALVCMLEHSPVLENLTLQLRKQEKAVEVEENPGLVEKPAAISGYLKIIKIKCEEDDDRVYKVLNFLSTFGIEITIERTNG